MKKSIFSIILALSLGASFSLSAQYTAVWQGGKPGRPSDWNCAANWKEGRVPNEFTQVIIPASTRYYPVIQHDAAPIDALLMEGGTTLTIHNGAMLTVLCETGIFDGVIILGHIKNDGVLRIQSKAGIDTALFLSMKGSGMLVHADMLAQKH